MLFVFVFIGAVFSQSDPVETFRRSAQPLKDLQESAQSADSALAWLWLGHAFRESGDLEAARQAYITSETRAPLDSRASVALARLAELNRQPEAAAAHWQRAYELNRDDSWISMRRRENAATLEDLSRHRRRIRLGLLFSSILPLLILIRKRIRKFSGTGRNHSA